MAVDDEIEDIREALVRVVAEWTQGELQTQVAASVGGSLDAIEVRALYVVGMHGGSLGFSRLADRAAMSRPTKWRPHREPDREEEQGDDPPSGKSSLRGTSRIHYLRHRPAAREGRTARRYGNLDRASVRLRTPRAS